MTVGDFVVFRSSLQVEYMQIGTLVSGTTYNVNTGVDGARNLDGSGANSWVAGQPFAVLGTTGDGRIELNAYDTPRIQLIRQGATYNTQTEIIRIGDLNGNWGYASQTWGVAIGEYGANLPNLTLDPTNGLRIRTNTTTIIQLDTSGNATIAGSLTIGPSGGIYQADGDVWLDDGGLGFDYTIGGDTSAVKWLNLGVVFASIVGKALSGARGMYFVAQRYEFFDGLNNQFIINTSGITVNNDVVAGGSVSSSGTIVAGTNLYVRGNNIYMKAPDLTDSRVFIASGDNLLVGDISNKWPGNLYFRVNGANVVYFSSSLAYFTQEIQAAADVKVSGGLSIGGASANPATGNVNYTGNLIPRRSSTDYTGYIFVPLTTPATNSNYDGDAKSSTASPTQIDLQSASFFNLPSDIKAVLVHAAIRDSGSAGGDRYIALGASATAGQNRQVLRCSGLPNDTWTNGTMVVPVNTSNGDIYIEIAASGALTMDVILEIHGYWI